MAKGVSRDGNGWVTVDYGNKRMPITEDRYREAGYEPPFEALPVIEDGEREG